MKVVNGSQTEFKAKAVFPMVWKAALMGIILVWRIISADAS